MRHDARCPVCWKALLLKFSPFTVPSTAEADRMRTLAPTMESSCRSCRALVTFRIVPNSSRPDIVSFKRRDEQQYALR